MKIENETIEYLTGQKFSTGCQLLITQKENRCLDCFTFLTNLSRDKNVIHIGAVDHMDVLDKKIRNKKWLHQALLKSCRNCVGIDINREGIDYLKSRHGIEGIHCANILDPDADLSFLNGIQWDYVFLPDVLEHLLNPADFLVRMARRLGALCPRLVITVPNALSLQNMKFARRNIECINSDHRYWFTPYTLCKVLVECGYQPEELLMAMRHTVSWRSPLTAGRMKLNPCMRDSIIVLSGFPGNLTAS